MFIDRFTEGEVIPSAGRAGNGDLRIGLNEIGRVFLAAMRAESGEGESIRKFIHDNPLEESQRFDAEKFKQYEYQVSNAAFSGLSAAMLCYVYIL
jgi:hypothetical protein